MEPTFDAFDAVAFAVFALLVAIGVVLVVSLGQLPGKLAQRWHHPQAAAVNVAGWVGLATGGLLWPLALIWAFWTPPVANQLPRSLEQ
jgi:ABC-type Mn2+/Zn2+ transport system permease subunit